MWVLTVINLYLILYSNEPLPHQGVCMCSVIFPYGVLSTTDHIYCHSPLTPHHPALHTPPSAFHFRSRVHPSPSFISSLPSYPFLPPTHHSCSLPLCSIGLLLCIIFYSYAIIGMEIFHGTVHEGCCRRWGTWSQCMCACACVFVYVYVCMYVRYVSQVIPANLSNFVEIHFSKMATHSYSQNIRALSAESAHKAFHRCCERFAPEWQMHDKKHKTPVVQRVG